MTFDKLVTIESYCGCRQYIEQENIRKAMATLEHLLPILTNVVNIN